jgi:flagellar L-ring protein precursor FlgH
MKTRFPLVPIGGMVALALSSGCANTHSIVDTPMYPPVSAAPINIDTQGSIYQQRTAMALFETPRAQHVGDVLTIQLSENYSGANSATAKASRNSSITATAATQSTNTAARLAKLFNVGTAATSFDGSGSLTDTDAVTGTLAVTVIDVMPSGNLLVSGEKVIASGGNRDRLRLSGVVNPKDIQAGNYVSSTKVANARIEQAGSGMLADATTLGWLQRMFMSALTF